MTGGTITAAANAAVGLRNLNTTGGAVALAGGAALSGIGFTIALFIVDLALGEGELADQARLGVLVASVLAALLGSALFRLAARRGDMPLFWSIVEERMATPEAEFDLLRAVEIARGKRSALLCFEADPHVCHRQRVADALAERFGFRIEHIHPTTLA